MDLFLKHFLLLSDYLNEDFEQNHKKLVCWVRHIQRVILNYEIWLYRCLCFEILFHFIYCTFWKLVLWFETFSFPIWTNSQKVGMLRPPYWIMKTSTRNEMSSSQFLTADFEPTQKKLTCVVRYSWPTILNIGKLTKQLWFTRF